MSKLIINEHPLLVLPSLATVIGLNEAIILQQVHYWLDPRINNNIRNGMLWVYNTYNQWSKQFPFWSEVTIRRTIKSLESKKLLISDNFNKNSFAKQKWYTIDYTVLAKLEKSLKNKTDSSSSDQIDRTSDQIDQSDRSKRSEVPINLIASYIDTKNTSETTQENSLSLLSNVDKIKDNNLSSKTKERERENQMLKIWNEIIEFKNEDHKKLTSKREKLLNLRLKEFFNCDISLWKDFCKKIVSSKFLMGEVTNFRIQLDWVLEEDNMIKVLENSYKVGDRTITENKDSNLIEQELMDELQRSDTPEFWQQMMLILMKEKGVPTFRSWFKKNLYNNFKDGVLEIKAFSKFEADWQTQHFFDDIFKACKKTIANFKELKIIY
jgi:hypothetical protein